MFKRQNGEIAGDCKEKIQKNPASFNCLIALGHCAGGEAGEGSGGGGNVRGRLKRQVGSRRGAEDAERARGVLQGVRQDGKIEVEDEWPQ
jgi:hypothetical protein